MSFQPGDRVVLRDNFYNDVGSTDRFTPGNTGVVTETINWEDWLAVIVVIDGVESPMVYDYDGWIFDSKELDNAP